MDRGGPAPEAAARARKRALEEALHSELRATLVVNTHSRSGRRLYEEACRALAARGLQLAATHAVRDAARLPEIVRAAIAGGERLVVVGGGDGTLNAVVDCFARRDAVLAVLPVGTANSFARAVGIPLDLDGAVDVAVGGKVADVDLGVVDGSHFASTAAIGLPASIAHDMPKQLKRRLGRAGYLLVAGRRLLRHRPFRCTLTLPGRQVAFEALEVRIANGEYQGGVRVAGAAGVETRDLVVQAIRGRSRLAVARFWWRAMLGLDPGRSAEVEVLRAPYLSLETVPPQEVSIDGEPVGRTPLHARIARQALLLRVPQAREDIE